MTFSFFGGGDHYIYYICLYILTLYIFSSVLFCSLLFSCLLSSSLFSLLSSLFSLLSSLFSPLSSLLSPLSSLPLSSYTTEIVEDVDNDVPELNAAGRVWEVCTMFSFMILTTIVAIAAGVDEVGKGRIAQILACAISAYPMYLVGKGLLPRPALSKVPPGSSVVAQGFLRLSSTFRDLRSSNPEVGRFLLALVFVESGNSNLISASTTVITQQLKIEDPAMVLLFILVVMIPGAALAPLLQRLLGLKRATMVAVAANMLGTLSVVLFVNTPERRGFVWFTGIFYGLGMGITYVSVGFGCLRSAQHYAQHYEKFRLSFRPCTSSEVKHTELCIAIS